MTIVSIKVKNIWLFIKFVYDLYYIIAIIDKYITNI
jgi:hypothetical protein